ncbi:permease [Geobacillus sp. Y412MC52]|uniref:permease n=1 Tax=Geobacillus sp. (strain Y412MC52) TaxID=550542 RepID=UPI00018C12D8|nr:permease [Geobacillus sp. Y412MC52]ADU94742.1 permease [Geobacillus sp. Y412MC52]
MWDIVWNTTKEFISLAKNLLILFVLITYLINILEYIIPFDKLEKSLFAKNRFLANISGALLGFVTPFCSCSTIPMLVTMFDKNVPFQTAMTFLFTSPLLDPWILTMMAYILGWKVTIIYTFVTLVISMIIGWLLDKWGFKKYVKNVRIKGIESPQLEGSRKVDWKKAWKDTLSLLKSVYIHILVGSLIGAFIKEAIPHSLLEVVSKGSQWWVIPLAAIVGVPLYIRLSTMLPVSQSLIAKGLPLAPTMALLIGGAGASLPEIIMLSSLFKKQLLIAFIASVFIMATFSGYLFLIIN